MVSQHRLPDLTENVSIQRGSMPIAGGGFSDVWCAVLRTRDVNGLEINEKASEQSIHYLSISCSDFQVAVKVLRAHSIVADDRQRDRISRVCDSC